MKKLSIALIAAMSVLTFALPAQASWKQAKNANGVKVWTKDVPGQALKAMRAETVITAKLSDIGYLLNSPSAYKEWVADVTTSKLVKRVSDRNQYLYFIQKTPIVKDRDVVIHGKVSQNPSTKVVTVTMKNAKGMVKENSKYVRVPKMDGKLTFTPIGGGKVKVLYELQADPGGKIPGSIANSFAVKTPYETLRGLKKISGNLAKYRNKNIEPLKDAS